ncbi:MAG: Eco47II family restriction endonuclease [Microbacterium sp.]
MSATPTLDWIDIDKVVEIAVREFRAGADKVLATQTAGPERVEPTLAVVRAALAGMSLEEGALLDVGVGLTKTIQNKIGSFHQEVLGAVDGWSSTGANGGVIDLKGHSPVLTGARTNVWAEVKMRYNTIKASDEKAMWDKIKTAVSLAGNDTVGYLFQIIPKTLEPYDCAWAPSGVVPNDLVRCADGVTAYHLVTGRPTALRELLDAMPYVMAQVVETLMGRGLDVTRNFEHSGAVLADVIDRSIPSRSALE